LAKLTQTQHAPRDPHPFRSSETAAFRKLVAEFDERDPRQQSDMIVALRKFLASSCYTLPQAACEQDVSAVALRQQLAHGTTSRDVSSDIRFPCPDAMLATDDGMDPRFVSRRYVATLFGESQARELMRKIGLSARGDELPRAVSKLTFHKLCVEYTLQHRDESLGIREKPTPLGRAFGVHAAVSQMDTMGDGLIKYAELATSMDSDLSVRIARSPMGVHVHLGHQKWVENTEKHERFIEAVGLILHCVMRYMTGHRLRPVKVRVSGMLNDRDGCLLSGFGCLRERYGEGVTIVYDHRDVALPSRGQQYKYWGANEVESLLELFSELEELEPDQTCHTVDMLRQLIARGVYSQTQAARHMDVSTATLRRRLAGAGTTFREISIDVRRDRLRTMLATGVSVDDIAMELGLSDRRSLWRTCHQWLGMSPAAYRKMHGGRSARG
jgi:AraC-like DNA-binding protein